MRDRVIRCDICGTTYLESEIKDGFPGWGSVQGIIKKKKEDDLNSPLPDNVSGIIDLCPIHLNIIASVLDQMEEQITKVEVERKLNDTNTD